MDRIENYIKGLNKDSYGKSLLIQGLEGTFIIENSNSPDTVIGRCKFLKDNLSDIIEIRKDARYNLDVQEAVDHYKQTYYDRLITNTQVSLLAVASKEQWNIFFFTHIERSFYDYVDKQLYEISILKRSDAKAKRRSALHKLVVNCNYEMLKLFISGKTNNDYLDKVALLTKSLYNYIELKINKFDEAVIVQVNEIEYLDENKAPISEAARKLIKQLKSKLWAIQFDIINQEYKIKLRVNGDNVALALDLKADSKFTQKIKSAFTITN
jgi:hypothetical protein